jgi:hypothetical protein
MSAFSASEARCRAASGSAGRRPTELLVRLRREAVDLRVGRGVQAAQRPEGGVRVAPREPVPRCGLRHGSVGRGRRPSGLGPHRLGQLGEVGAVEIRDDFELRAFGESQLERVARAA